MFDLLTGVDLVPEISVLQHRFPGFPGHDTRECPERCPGPDPHSRGRVRRSPDPHALQVHINMAQTQGVGSSPAPIHVGEEAAAAIDLLHPFHFGVRLPLLEVQVSIPQEPGVGVEFLAPGVKPVIGNHQQQVLRIQALHDSRDDGIHLPIDVQQRSAVGFGALGVVPGMQRIDEAVEHVGGAVGGREDGGVQGGLIPVQLVHQEPLQMVHVAEEVLQEDLLVDLLLIEAPGLMNPAVSLEWASWVTRSSE